MSDRRPLKLENVEPLGETDRRWQRHLEDLQLQALPAIRASAEKWAASISVILAGAGLAALLEGPDQFNALAEPWQGVGKVAFFAGAVLGLVALCFAAAAAHATTQNLLRPTASELRRVSAEAVDGAVGKLARSRVCAALAIAALLVAAFSLWWGPHTSRASGPPCVAAKTAPASDQSVLNGASPTDAHGSPR